MPSSLAIIIIIVIIIIIIIIIIICKLGILNMSHDVLYDFIELVGWLKNRLMHVIEFYPILNLLRYFYKLKLIEASINCLATKMIN